MFDRFWLMCWGLGRSELTDKAWAVIAPLLPEPGHRSGGWREHRQAINGILRKLRAGAPWWDLPGRYGPWKTGNERLRCGIDDGTWERTLARALVQADEASAQGQLRRPATSDPGAPCSGMVVG
jgi:transposase